MSEKTQGNAGAPALLPHDWRSRRGLPPRCGRFSVQRVPGENPISRWQVEDAAYATCLGFETRWRAEQEASFFRDYARRWGDVDLCSAPYDIDQPLRYDDMDQARRWWTERYPEKP